VLFRDYIRGTGPQRFAVRVTGGDYNVFLLHPDHTTSQLKLTAANRRLEIPMPGGEWSISGIVIKTAVPGEQSAKIPVEPKPLPRPRFRHEAPPFAQPAEQLKLELSIPNPAHVTRVRLYYRPLNQLASFKLMEQPPGQPFMIPGGDITGEYDLMYYFEVLNDVNGGWFQLDPLVQTPYYVVRTSKAVPPATNAGIGSGR
jgi:hypothetical protein